MIDKPMYTGYYWQCPECKATSVLASVGIPGLENCCYTCLDSYGTATKTPIMEKFTYSCWCAKRNTGVFDCQIHEECMIHTVGEGKLMFSHHYTSTREKLLTILEATLK